MLMAPHSHKFGHRDRDAPRGTAGHSVGRFGHKCPHAAPDKDKERVSPNRPPIIDGPCFAHGCTTERRPSVSHYGERISARLGAIAKKGRRCGPTLSRSPARGREQVFREEPEYAGGRSDHRSP